MSKRQGCSGNAMSVGVTPAKRRRPMAKSFRRQAQLKEILGGCARAKRHPLNDHTETFQTVEKRAAFCDDATGTALTVQKRHQILAAPAPPTLPKPTDDL